MTRTLDIAVIFPDVFMPERTRLLRKAQRLGSMYGRADSYLATCARGDVGPTRYLSDGADPDEWVNDLLVAAHGADCEGLIWTAFIDAWWTAFNRATHNGYQLNGNRSDRRHDAITGCGRPSLR